MKGQDYEPTGLEKLIAQWPLFAGLALIGIGLLYVWYAKSFAPHIIYTRPLIMLMAGGVVLILYWAFAGGSGKSSY